MRSYLLILVFMISGCPLAQEGSYSYYCSFSHEPTIDGYYSDSLVINGPFRANGPIWLYSKTPGRLPATEPHCGDLWIEPYEFMVQGPPWFTLGAEPESYKAPTPMAWLSLTARTVRQAFT